MQKKESQRVDANRRRVTYPRACQAFQDGSLATAGGSDRAHTVLEAHRIHSFQFSVGIIAPIVVREEPVNVLDLNGKASQRARLHPDSNGVLAKIKQGIGGFHPRGEIMYAHTNPNLHDVMAFEGASIAELAKGSGIEGRLCSRHKTQITDYET